MATAEIDQELATEEAAHQPSQPSEANQRMFYEQTMENYRQMIRASVSYIFMSLAIQGLGIQVILSDATKPSLAMIVAWVVLALSALQLATGLVGIAFSRRQRATLDDVRIDLGLQEDRSLRTMETWAWLLCTGLTILVVAWVVFITSGMLASHLS